MTQMRIKCRKHKHECVYTRMCEFITPPQEDMLGGTKVLAYKGLPMEDAVKPAKRASNAT